MHITAGADPSSDSVKPRLALPSLGILHNSLLSARLRPEAMQVPSGAAAPRPQHSMRQPPAQPAAPQPPADSGSVQVELCSPSPPLAACRWR